MSLLSYTYNEALFIHRYCTGYQTTYNNIFNVLEDKTNP